MANIGHTTLIYIVFALLIVACEGDNTKGDIFADTQLEDVTFVTQSPLRGAMADSASDIENFGVFAYESGAEDIFMSNIEVLNADGEWIYSPRQSWPVGGYNTLQFYAYSPYAASSNGITPLLDSTSDEPYIEFSTLSEVAQQVDFMIGRTSIITSTGDVNIEFFHALAAVEFRVAECDSKYDIDSIIIRGVISSGEVSIFIGSSNEVVWKIGEERAEYTIKPNEEEQTLFAIPQSIDDSHSIIVYYDGRWEEYSIPSSSQWDAGKLYTYEIVTTDGVISLSGIENCYVVNPSLESIYSFDGVSRVNQFWGSSSSGGVDALHLKTTADGDGYIALGSEENAIGEDDRWYMELIWADFEDENPITLLQSEGSEGVGSEAIVFSLNTLTHGNLLIGIKKEGGSNYLWSWHLWITDYDPNNPSAAMYLPTEDASGFWNNSREMMDRNLGAISTDRSSQDSYGLYYQWGRKDPFYRYGCHYGSDNDQSSAYSDNIKTSTSGSLLNIVNFPSTFYYSYFFPNDPYSETNTVHSADDFNRWGGNVSSTSTEPFENDKTIYDPCPEGWRVPTGENWGGFSDDNFTYTNYGQSMPCAGYRQFLSNTYLFSLGSQGIYWSASATDTYLYSTYAYTLTFDADLTNVNDCNTATRANGYPVRAIRVK